MDDAGDAEFDHLLKLVLIGNSGVGKTCLLMKFADGTFTENYVSTIGVDFRVKMLNVDGKKVKLQIWDTAGQERFRTICSSYYRGANGIVIVYDTTDQESFNNVPVGWAPEVEKNAPADVVKLIVGTKIDLQDQRVVSSEEGKELSDKCGARFLETSAKNGQGVADAFETIARDALEKIVGKGNSGAKSIDLVSSLDSSSAPKPTKFRFCTI